MSIFSEIGNFFTGSKDAKAARQSAGLVSEGEKEKGRIGAKYAREGMDTAQGFLGQYAGAGQGANNILMDLLGINGPEAQQSAYGNFNNPPGFQEAVDFGSQNAMQSGVNFGNLRSGATMSALQGVGQRAKYGALQDWMDRLTGQQAQGVNLAGRQAGVAETGFGNIGNALSGAALGSAQAQAGGILGERNARNAGMGRTVGLAGNALSAYMGMPGGGFGGGGNNMASVGMTPQNYNLPWRR